MYCILCPNESSKTFYNIIEINIYLTNPYQTIRLNAKVQKFCLRIGLNNRENFSGLSDEPSFTFDLSIKYCRI